MKACIIVVLVLGLGACSRHDAVPSSSKSRPSPTEVPQPKSIVYPYSVVPGGVRTREDVQSAIESDAQTALHYAGINVATLQPVTLRAASRAYVSFRKKGVIYWTRKPVSLPAGERLLSNGRDCIRQRCGNRVSVQPQKPVLPEAEREIASGTLNTPQTPTGLILEELLPAPTPVTPGFASPTIPSPMVTPPPEVISTGSLPGGLTGGAGGGGGMGGGGGTSGPGTGSPGLPGIILPTSPQAPQLPGTTVPPTTPIPVYPVVPVGPTTPVTPTPPVTITFEFPPVTPPIPSPPTVFPPSIPPGSMPPPTTVVIVYPPPPGITPPETPPGQPTPPGTPPAPPVTPCCTTTSFPPPETPPGIPVTPSVPEPASLILMSAGLLVVAGLGARKLR